MKNNIISFIKRPRNIIIIILTLLVILGAYSYFFKKPSIPTDNIYTTKRGDLIQEVSVSGKVKPAETVDLGFERSGRINRINISVGDKVYSGQILASLSNVDAQAQLEQAQAQLDSQKAKLESLKKGARPEDIQISESELKKAQQDLVNIYANTYTILSDAYSKADDAVRKQTASFFTNPDSDNPQISFSSTNSQAAINTQYQRTISKNELVAWIAQLQSIQASQTNDNLDSIISKSKNHLAVILDFLNGLADVLNNSTGLTSSALDSYKANLTTARLSITTAMTNINNQKQAIDAQKIIIERAQSQLALKKAGAAAEDIAAQEAAVRQAQANVLNYRDQLEKTYIRAPINGIVTKQNSQVGEIINPNNPFISLISQAQFEIEANVPEADIAKIKLGDQTRVTLDAYGNDVVFKAKITKIDPAETVLEGVATYKTTFHFTDNDDRIKSGMTANLDIATAKKEDVLIIPQRAISTQDNKKFVSIINANQTSSLIEIKTGLRGSDGNIEVVSGLNEGDKILIVIK